MARDIYLAFVITEIDDRPNTLENNLGKYSKAIKTFILSDPVIKL